MVYSPVWGSRYATILIKYFVQSVRTLAILFRDRPRVVFVMAPPVVACAPVWLYCLVRRAQFVIDAHTGAFLDPEWKRVSFLQRFFSRRATTTIVTNRHLQQLVEEWGAEATIVTDVPVCFAEPEHVELSGAFNVTVVSSFANDEPTAMILEAAAHCPDIRFYMTGNPSDLESRVLKSKPDNVQLTGFLSDARYVGQLQASDAVMVLTTRDHTMQRGAYEAVYLGKPVITSNFELLRTSFSKGTVYVDSTVADIVRGIREMRSDVSRFQEEVDHLRDEKLQQWDAVAASLLERLGVTDVHVNKECLNEEIVV